eukprot:1418770-Pyramimonas_sp.AAC.2
MGSCRRVTGPYLGSSCSIKFQGVPASPTSSTLPRRGSGGGLGGSSVGIGRFEGGCSDDPAWIVTVQLISRML